jgi:hypothetical protein
VIATHGFDAIAQGTPYQQRIIFRVRRPAHRATPAPSG